MRKTEPKTNQKLAFRTSLSTGFLRRYVFPSSDAAQYDVPTSPPPSQRERERREREEREEREKRELRDKSEIRKQKKQERENK